MQIVRLYTPAGEFDVEVVSLSTLEDSYPIFASLKLAFESGNIHIRRTEIIAFKVMYD